MRDFEGESTVDSKESKESEYHRFLDAKQSNSQDSYEGFMKKNRLIMMPVMLGTLMGSYFNIYFQNFIQDQLMEYFDMSSSMYSWFVLIPNLPNIVIPLLIGPLVQKVGLRTGLFLATTLLMISMGVCILAAITKSTAILILGKAILHVSVEAQGIPHSCLISKWFGTILTTAYTVCSFINKANSSTSGIIYPQLYKAYDSPMFPFMIGFLMCAVSFLSSIIVCRIDKKYDELVSVANSQTVVSNTSGVLLNPATEVQSLKFSDLKKFNRMYWLYICQSPLMFGAFNAYTSYLQKIMTTKYSLDKTEAGEMASIPFWVAFSTPLFGMLADKFGQRSVLLCLTTVFSTTSALMLLLLPGDTNVFLIIIGLAILGLFLSAMCAFLYPTIPLITEKKMLSSGFAIAFSAKNAGTSLLSFLGGHLMGDQSQGYDDYLTLYLSIFSLSLLLAIGMFFYDRHGGSIINSRTPHRFMAVQEERKKQKQLNRSAEYETIER